MTIERIFFVESLMQENSSLPLSLQLRRGVPEGNGPSTSEGEVRFSPEECRAFGVEPSLELTGRNLQVSFVSGRLGKDGYAEHMGPGDFRLAITRLTKIEETLWRWGSRYQETPYYQLELKSFETVSMVESAEAEFCLDLTKAEYQACLELPGEAIFTFALAPLPATD